jgi:hypothetical protein
MFSTPPPSVPNTKSCFCNGLSPSVGMCALLAQRLDRCHSRLVFKSSLIIDRCPVNINNITPKTGAFQVGRKRYNRNLLENGSNDFDYTSGMETIPRNKNVWLYLQQNNGTPSIWESMRTVFLRRSEFQRSKFFLKS